MKRGDKSRRKSIGKVKGVRENKKEGKKE